MAAVEPAARVAGRRLVLRPLVEADAPALWEAVEASRESLKRRLGWAAGALDADAELGFIRAAAAAAAGGRGQTWGVFEAPRGGGEGRVAGVAAVKAEGRDPLRLRLGLWVRTDRQDRGYGSEAARLAAEHAFKRLGARRLWARLDPSNRAFRKVLKRLDFRYEGCLRAHKRLNGRWVDQECWGLLRTEWKRG